MARDDRKRARSGCAPRERKSFRPRTERLESRQLLSYADGNGPVVTSITAQRAQFSATVVVSFDGPLDQALAQNTANYQVNALAPGNPEVVTRSGPADRVVSALYNTSTNQVTLTLARPLATGTFYRLWINGTPGSGLTDTSGTLFDGDNDDTPGGNFYGLFAVGNKLCFTDSDGNRALLRLSGGGQLDLWRELNGDVDLLTIVGTEANQSTLTGSVRAGRGSDGEVVLPSIVGLSGVDNLLPPSFVSQAPAVVSPLPVVATTQNLPYALQITPVSLPSVPSIQSAVSVQAGGKWLVFGGRTNGLHNFDPSGTVNFPPVYQNNDIFVIDPTTGQTWSEPWSASGLSASAIAALSSSNQAFFQSGDRLYTVGGYSFDPVSGQFTTYDALSAISVSGLINAVVNHGAIGAQVKQIQDPRLAVAGGQFAPVGNRAYLVFGQNFEGGYNGNNADFSQVYTDEVRSFHIVDRGSTLAITSYQAQRDPVNFRRRDYNLAPSILPNGRQGLTAFGGVFTPAGNGYRFPIIVRPNGSAQVDNHYEQYFSQYTSANVPLFDARQHTMDTIFFGGIGLYDYNFTTGALTTDTELPFVDDVTSFVQRANGSAQEYIMPSQLPGRYGSDAAFFRAPGLPTYSNGVIQLNRLHGPTTLGYIYGGIYSQVGDTTDPSTQTTASNQVFKVTLIPT
ncbi:MAG: hypothetical protein P4L84_03990 [Isosphaeraceae bacterium]|nr:hypothetical protein [Isosphaeraceae bacterium]